MKLLKVLVFIAIGSLHSWSWANGVDYQLNFQGGMYSFDVSSSDAASSSVSGFGAYSLAMGLVYEERYLVQVGIALLASEGVTGDGAFGFDGAVRYYPWTAAGIRSYESGPLTVELSNLTRPYFGVAFRHRQFLSVLSSTYLGMGVYGGVDHMLDDVWFLNGEFRYDYLMGQSESTATQMNILIGIGHHF